MNSNSSASNLSIAQSSANSLFNPNSTSYYYGTGGQLSPSCNSVSSISSFDSNNSPNTLALNSTFSNAEKASTSESSTSERSLFLLSVNTTSTEKQKLPLSSTTQHLSQNNLPSASSSKTIVIRKGPQGYGFTIQSVRVYLR